MIREPEQSKIDYAFRDTDFGPDGKTAKGRRKLVADCVLKRACGHYDGWTITLICKELGLLTANSTPRRWAKQWAYSYINRVLKP